VAGVVIPTPDYVRFATHYGFSPDFCAPADPASKGIVENLVGYAKSDVATPTDSDLASWNQAAADWCAERNSIEHSEICAVPTDRLAVEVELLRPLPACQPRIGRAEIRKVDKLSTIRVASARYSVPSVIVAMRVEAVTYDGVVRIYRIDSGELVATTISSARASRRSSTSTIRPHANPLRVDPEPGPTSSTSSSPSASTPPRISAAVPRQE
jgi:hypothetical protein